MKKIVVSALFNGHDYLKDPVLDGYNPEWDYILFTDDEYLQSDYWQIIPMQGSRESARSLKIKTHKHLKFDVCLWVDPASNVEEFNRVYSQNLGPINRMNIQKSGPLSQYAQSMGGDLGQWGVGATP